MKVSVVTVCLNAETTIAQTLESVAKQNYKDIEHIVVDGASTDSTLEVIQANRAHVKQLISEPDKGLYDAMNKGLALATGDIVGMLNADDVYQNSHVIERIVDEFKDDSVDAVYADLVYVKHSDTSQVRRKYTSGKYQVGQCFDGWMPAHPTFYVRRDMHKKIGLYNTGVGAQADLEYCARAFEIHKIRSRYIDQVWVRMRLGGISNGSVLSRINANWGSYQALKKIGLKSSPIAFFYKKFSAKLPGFVNK